MIGAVVARPRHCALGLLALGLASGAALPSAVLAGAVALLGLGVGCALGGRRRAAGVALLCVAALVAGAAGGSARVQALEQTRLPTDFGHAVSERVILLEARRLRAFGQRTAVARLRGERIVLRAGARVRWPAAEVGAELWVRGGLAAPDRVATATRAHAVLRLEAVAVTGRRRGGVLGVVDGVRVRAQRALDQDLPPGLAALLRGMVLGQDADMPEAMREEFRASGLAHLTAASGQNVMLLAALALACGTLAGLGLRGRLGCALALVLVYVPLAGAGPSIQRAGIMGAAGIIAALAGRPAARWYAVLLAAVVTLGLDPRAWSDIGWQLSFAAVIALLAIAPPLRDRLVARGSPRGLAEATAVTLAATLATAPLLALHFDRVSLVSLPANVLVAPAVAPIMWLGMLSAAVGQFAPAVSAWFDALAGLPLAFVAWLARAAAGLPGASVPASVGTVTVLCGALCVVLAGGHRRLACTPPARWVAARIPAVGPTRRGPRRVVLALAGLAGVWFALGSAIPAPAPPGALRVTFLDIGQGDATLVQHGRAAMLFDAGPPDGPILRRLREQGVRRLDVLVLTHSSTDHDGGLAAVLKEMPVGLLVDGRDGQRTPGAEAAVREARARGVRSIRSEAGLMLRAGPITVRVLWPPSRPATPPGVAAAPPGEDANLRATVAEVRDGPTRVLLPADAESDVLSGLDLPRVDAYKVSHHGSRDEGLAPVLQRLAPAVAVVSVGRGNLYGHPVASTLGALRTAGAEVLRTDQDGTVRLDFPPGGGRPQVTRDVR